MVLDSSCTDVDNYGTNGDRMITYCQGYKHPDDVKVCINDHVITFRELAEITVQLIKNEDNIYPKPKFKGGDMLIDFLNECMDAREVREDIIKRYKL